MGNYIYGCDGIGSQTGGGRADIGQAAGRAALRWQSHVQPTQPAALPGRIEGRYTAGGVEETDERWPDSLRPSCRSLDTRKALSLHSECCLQAAVTQTAPKHTTQLIELIYMCIYYYSRCLEASHWPDVRLFWHQSPNQKSSDHLKRSQKKS